MKRPGWKGNLRATVFMAHKYLVFVPKLLLGLSEVGHTCPNPPTTQSPHDRPTSGTQMCRFLSARESIPNPTMRKHQGF